MGESRVRGAGGGEGGEGDGAGAGVRGRRQRVAQSAVCLSAARACAELTSARKKPAPGWPKAVESAALEGGYLERPRQWLGTQWPGLSHWKKHVLTGCGAALCEPPLTAGDARVDEHKGVWPLLTMQGHARRDEVPPRREAHRHDGPSVGVPPRLAYGSWGLDPQNRRPRIGPWAALGSSAARPECAPQPAA